jgi:hypothetical protein
MRQVISLGAERDGRRDGMLTGPDDADPVTAERQFRLRRAALLDRMALDDPGPGALGAAPGRGTARPVRPRAPRVGGRPPRAYSIGWDPSHRPYVRQEYAAWTDAGHSTADGC